MFNNFRENFVITMFNLRFTIFTYHEPFYYNNLASSITGIDTFLVFLNIHIRNMII